MKTKPRSMENPDINIRLSYKGVESSPEIDPWIHDDGIDTNEQNPTAETYANSFVENHEHTFPVPQKCTQNSGLNAPFVSPSVKAYAELFKKELARQSSWEDAVVDKRAVSPKIEKKSIKRSSPDPPGTLASPKVKVAGLFGRDLVQHDLWNGEVADDNFASEAPSRVKKTKKKDDRERVAVLFRNNFDCKVMVRALGHSGSDILVIMKEFNNEISRLLRMKRVTFEMCDPLNQNELAKTLRGVDRAVLVTGLWEQFEDLHEEKQAMTLINACQEAQVSQLLFSSIEDTKRLRDKGSKSQLIPQKDGSLCPSFDGMRRARKKAKKLKVKLTHMITSYLDYEKSGASLCVISGQNGKLIITPCSIDEDEVAKALKDKPKGKVVALPELPTPKKRITLGEANISASPHHETPKYNDNGKSQVSQIAEKENEPVLSSAGTRVTSTDSPSASSPTFPLTSLPEKSPKESTQASIQTNNYRDFKFNLQSDTTPMSCNVQKKVVAPRPPQEQFNQAREAREEPLLVEDAHILPVVEANKGVLHKRTLPSLPINHTDKRERPSAVSSLQIISRNVKKRQFAEKKDRLVSAKEEHNFAPDFSGTVMTMLYTISSTAFWISWEVFVRIPGKILSFTFFLTASVVVLSIIWLYFDEHRLSQFGYNGYNLPGVY